jgi:hypothetical protein
MSYFRKISRRMKATLTAPRLTRGRAAALGVTLGSLGVLGVPACSSEDIGQTDTLPPGPPATAADGSPVYRHPVSQLSRRHAAGELPIFDRKNSATGRRYAMGDRLVGDDSGKNHVESGVIELERAKAPAADLTERVPDRTVPVVAARLAGSIGRQVLEVTLRRPAAPPVAHRLKEAVARGRITTRAERAAVRNELLEQKRVGVARLQEPVARAVESLGGRVLSRCAASHCLTIELDASEIEALVAAAPEITAVEPQVFTENEAVDGLNMAAAIQVNQFYGSTEFDGREVNPSGLDVGQFESGRPEITHVGYNVNSTNWTRILAQYDCTASPCDSDASGISSDDHASAVAGIMLGSLTNGQDSRYSNANDRLRRSGYARQAQLVTYSANYSVAMDHLLNTLNGPPEMLNMSAGLLDSARDPVDPTCTGTDASSKKANEVFEDGVAFFKSAGNAGLGRNDGTDCTVTAPGAAIGVMPIASNGNVDNYQDAGTGEADIRTSGIASNSSIGGNATEGDERSIIGLTAYGCRTKLFDTGGSYGYERCGTSFASPTVVGTALDFMDFYLSTFSDFIDDPGVLYANMLLMGDRQATDGKITYGFDNRWGAGRLMARRTDAAGLDSPYTWGTNDICIDNGEEYTLALNSGNAFSSDVDVVKAVIWWYDDRHENGTTPDNVDLRLDTFNSSTNAWENKRVSKSKKDNKERVFVSGATVQNKKVRLRITGANVTNDNTGCGSNSMKVYLAYLSEDSDRDDADGPTSSVAPE